VQRSIVIVDEGVGQNTPLWQQFTQAMGERELEFLLLAERHRGIPDVEILDKLLDPSKILLTGDRVLHMRALERGFRSYTLNEHGQLTRKKLGSVRPDRKPLPGSVHASLLPEYGQDRPNPLTLRMRDGMSERGLKRYRTARRRIRAHFGSQEAISQLSVTLGVRRTKRGLICGFVFNLAGNSGVKGLKGTEGYCRYPGEGHAAVATLHGLREQYLLQLEGVPTQLFVTDTAALDLTRRLLAEQSAPGDPLERALWRLLRGLSRVEVLPCVKGRFHDGLVAKLRQLEVRPGNEMREIDFRGMAEGLVAE
jgi:hypothetical protein